MHGGSAHVGNRLIGSVNIGGGTNTIQVPSTPLGWTAMPRLDFGYRLGQGAGELLVSYRATATSGSRSIAANDFSTIRSRFQTHQADFAYASREDWALPGWVLRWQAGARLASVFFDSQGRGVSQVERVANEFIGVGPQFGLEMRRPTNIAGLSPFIRLDAAWVVGRIEQTFQESTNTPDSGLTRLAQIRSSPSFGFAVGLVWSPPNCERLCFVVGYAVEQWWDIGQVQGSRAEATIQGLLFRGEWRF